MLVLTGMILVAFLASICSINIYSYNLTNKHRKAYNQNAVHNAFMELAKEMSNRWGTSIVLEGAIV